MRSCPKLKLHQNSIMCHHAGTSNSFCSFDCSAIEIQNTKLIVLTLWQKMCLQYPLSPNFIKLQKLYAAANDIC